MTFTQQQHSHVLKFGNWDNDNNNIPCTTFFENRRKDKSAGVIRMNDPEVNPEALAYANMANNRQEEEEKTRAFSDGGDDKSNSDHCIKPTGAEHRRLKSDQKKGLAEGSMRSNSSSTAAAGYFRKKSGPSNNNHHRTTSVPKFGAWDEIDPTSGDGYTVIFNKVKEEKQSASSNFPPVPSQPSNYYAYGHQRKIRSSSSRSKVCCCLFWSKRE